MRLSPDPRATRTGRLCQTSHHVYKSVWTPFIGEELICHQESGNRSDPFAVAVLKPAASDSSMVVGHMLQKISAACSVFLELGE